MTGPVDPAPPPAEPTEASGTTAPPPEPAAPPAAPPVSPAGSPTPPLRADPDRPADSGWREPPWIPGQARARDRRPNAAAIVVGLILIGLGAYWFLDQTLGIAMPRISWGGVWPIILILIGGVILIRSLDRRP
jgi:hypothetical protein